MKTNTMLHQSLTRLEDIVASMSLEQKKLREELNRLLTLHLSTRTDEVNELKKLQVLSVDAVRELRQHNLQSGEDIAHQKARLQSYKVRKYDSYRE